MASPGQRRGKCGHAMALFDTHSHCARCREKGKGQDFCVENPESSDCPICKSFTAEQRLQISMPAYKIKKGKREAKAAGSTPSKDNEELVDPASVSVIGAVDNQGTVKSASAPPPEKKPKKGGKKDSKKVKSPSTKATSSQPTTDERFTELDHKWLERFSRLEALILAKNFEPSFSADIKVGPTHSPSQTQNVTEPFIRPSTSLLPGSGSSAEKHQLTSKAVTSSQTSSTQFTGTGFSATKHQPASQTKSSQPTSSVKFSGQGSSAPPHQPASKTKPHQPTAGTSGTDPQEINRPSATDRSLSSEPTDTGSPALHRSRKDSISILSPEADSMSDQPPLDLYAEEGELSEDQDQSVIEQDQPVSEEQNYRDTMQGIRSFMGWSNIPELENTTNTSDDNPFAGPKTVAPGKVSVKMPTEDWLCRKLAKLNLTLVEGYPSRGSEPGGLAKDVFLRLAKSQSKWYGLHTDVKTDTKADPPQLTHWSTDSSKLNSSYSRIAKYTGVSSTPPASRRISQETLRRWERSAREASVICNQQVLTDASSEYNRA